MVNKGNEDSATELSSNEGKSGSLWSNLSTEILFFTSVAGMSMVGGFSVALTMAKKRDQYYFSKGLVAGKDIPESGGSLALRALGRGSFYAFTGFSLFCLLTWKLSGVNSMDELRQKLGSIMPTLPKNQPKGRSEFTSLRDLVNYIIDEDEKAKSQSKKS